MDNYEISKAIKFFGELMDIHGEDPERAKTYQGVAFKIDNHPVPLEDLGLEEIIKEGFSKHLAQKIYQLVTEGSFPEMDRLVEKTPAGILEILTLKGLGPKKIAVLWKELGIENIQQLLQACKDNELVKLKGFGAKTQEKIEGAINYRLANSGKLLYAQAEILAQELEKFFIREYGAAMRFEIVGEYRRKLEVISSLEAVVVADEAPSLEKFPNPYLLPISIHPVKEQDFIRSVFLLTGTEPHTSAINIKEGILNSEEEIYISSGLKPVPPELREDDQWLRPEKNGAIPKLLQESDIRGTLHVHTTYSDGADTLEQMAMYCKGMGQEYLGICDHSKAAFYAGGLSEEKLYQQHAEIDRLNQVLAPFRIFKGIEADILSDGSLDYNDEVLSSLDFVVASVHSNLKMDKEKAMKRLLRAIENPHTTILGHMTGRLLLSRKGYEVDYDVIIDACAANGVIIELNANPRRLDMDWRQIGKALDKGVMVSVNPDAHSTHELSFTRYGINVARKAALTSMMTFNARGVREVESHFKSKKQISAS